MPTISHILNQIPDFQVPHSHTPIAFKSQQFQARAETSTTSQLSFLTAEGDRVSISAGSESRVSFDSYTAQGLLEGQTVDIRNKQLNTSFRSNFSLLVEGNLNEQELADIQAFLQTSQNLFRELSNGNVDQAAETAFSLKDLDSLASAGLFFRQETTVSVQARSTELVAQGNETSQRSQGRGNATEQSPTIEGFLERIRKAQEQFQIDPDRLAKRLPTLLSTLIETLDKPTSEEKPPQSPFEQIRKEFLPSLLQAIQNLTTKEDTPDEVREEDNNSKGDDFAPLPTVESKKILANPLKDSILSEQNTHHI